MTPARGGIWAASGPCVRPSPSSSVGIPPYGTRRFATPARPERDLAAHSVALVASPTEAAKAAEALLRRRYKWADEDKAEILVALGGDGFMLQTLHAMLEEGEARPVFGMNRGTFGFLMNEWRLDRLYERIQAAMHIRVAPLTMEATNIRGETWTHAYRKEDSYSRVDHILVSPGLASEVKERRARIYDGEGVREASDHRPVFVMLTLDPKQ